MSETTSLYDQFKERIKSHALYAKYAALELKNRKCAEYIFGVETTDDELYKKVIWKIEESAQRQVEWLFIQLCIKYGYPVAPPDRDSKCTCDHDILFEKGDKIIQVDFKSVLRPSDLFINRPKSKNKRPRRAPSCETDTYLVYLLKKNEEGYTWLEQRTSSDDLAKAVLVSDFIYSDAAEYDEWTEAYRKGLAFIDRALAKVCDRVIEVVNGQIIEYKGEAK